ncbi:MAG: hypothetical protein AMXMBFR84_19890 [Candidatus Hydrogenedentota bacterium]
MRRRLVRELGTLLGVAVILGGIVGLNIYMRLGSLQQKYTKMRLEAEAKREAEGVQLLKWDMLRNTKGTLKTGPTFDPALKEYNERIVNIMGYMTPIDEFRNATHFMLLPMTLECYFCEAPPLRDIIQVKMLPDQHVNIVDQPVLISGGLVLHEGPKNQFFYSIENASLEPGVFGQKMTNRQFTEEHMGHMIQGSDEFKEEILPPVLETPAGGPAQ